MERLRLLEEEHKAAPIDANERIDGTYGVYAVEFARWKYAWEAVEAAKEWR